MSKSTNANFKIYKKMKMFKKQAYKIAKIKKYMFYI